MNVIEALKVAENEGKKVRPIGASWFVKYVNDTDEYKRVWGGEANIGYDWLMIDNLLEEWEVVEDENKKLNIDEIENLIDEKIEIVKKEIYEKVNRWIDEIW